MTTFLSRNSPIMNGVIGFGVLNTVLMTLEAVVVQPHCVREDTKSKFDHDSSQMCMDCDLFWDRVTTASLLLGTSLMMKINIMVTERLGLA